MLDKSGRLIIGLGLLERCKHISIKSEVSVLYNQVNKFLVLKTKGIDSAPGMYYVASLKIDEKGRIIMPSSVRKAFPEATYLPTEKDGEIYIFIITK